MSVRKNITANYIGQCWRALMSLAFVPIYIKYLGIEAYGLIGVFAVLQACLSMLDVGLKPALGREMARFVAGAHTPQSIRDLLRSVEILGCGIAVVVVVGIWAASSWLASDWLSPTHIPIKDVANAFTVMGFVTALRFIEDIYVSSVVGLQLQVAETIVSSVMATARGLGAVGILAWVSPSIRAFFVWQAVISLITVPVLATVVYRALPASPGPARLSWSALTEIRRFAAGMFAITLLALLLTQVDKILLSRLLPLTAFAQYALAGAVANVLYMLTGPISAAFFPRLTELVTRHEETALRKAYHLAAQLVTVLMGAAAIVLIMFGNKVLLLWTQDAALAKHVSGLLAVIALGTLLHGLMWMPYQLQLAYGWTTLAINVNIAAVAILVPAIFLAVPAYGAIGAAWVWVILNSGYVVFSIFLMHRRLLPAEKWRWYLADVIAPLAAGFGVSEVCRLASPSGTGNLVNVGFLAMAAACVLFAMLLAAPMLRSQLTRYAISKLQPIYARWRTVQGK
jgi:O-antigen/teichoic acid export membrane protein